MLGFGHNEDIYSGTSYTTSMATNAGGDFLSSSSSYSSAMVGPSLSFILFLCVDILFILLFFALYAILIKKHLWLWHKNRHGGSAAGAGVNNSTATTLPPTPQQSPHSHHQLDKFNAAMKQRYDVVLKLIPAPYIHTIPHFIPL